LILFLDLTLLSQPNCCLRPCHELKIRLAIGAQTSMLVVGCVAYPTIRLSGIPNFCFGVDQPSTNYSPRPEGGMKLWSGCRYAKGPWVDQQESTEAVNLAAAIYISGTQMSSLVSLH
jgi:hypothetical protein